MRLVIKCILCLVFIILAIFLAAGGYQTAVHPAEGTWGRPGQIIAGVIIEAAAIIALRVTYLIAKLK